MSGGHDPSQYLWTRKSPLLYTSNKTKMECVLASNTTRTQEVFLFFGYQLTPDDLLRLFPMHLVVSCMGTKGQMHLPAAIYILILGNTGYLTSPFHHLLAR